MSSDGYDIQAVSDGNDALGQISMIRPDVVLIDVSLPGQNAFELKRAVNAQPDLAGIPFVLMSSAFEKVDETQAAEVEFSGRLTKPFDPAHLRDVIQKALASSARLELDVSMENLPILPDIQQELVSDDWMKAPVEPVEPVMSAPPFTLPVSQLWENEPRITIEPPSIPQENDIKHLTEATIRMSGLNDFEWSVSEPLLKPPSEISRSFDEPRVSLSESEDHDGDHDDDEIEIPSMDDLPELPTDDDNAILNPEQLYVDSSEAQTLSPPIFQAQQPQETQATASFSSEQMESLIRQELAKILPDLAEKMIKDEIHKMLTEA